METQATTPAPAQVSEPVHPIHQETAILDRLTRHVQNTPDNDPHAGTDLEAPPEQEPQAEAPDTPETPPEVEFDEETPVFDIGLPDKLSFKQLREGYLAKQDYHRNIQKVKAEEKSYQEKAAQATSEAAKQYAQHLETFKQALVKFAAPELQNVDLNTLADQDPAQAQKIFFKQLQFNQTLQQIQSEQQKAMEKAQADQKKQYQESVQKARETLTEKIKGWNDETYQRVLKAGVDEYGFTPEEVSAVVDPRVIELLHDASEYRSLKKAKPEIQKKVVAVPKVIKPGSADKPNPSAEAIGEAEKRLKKTGDWRDAANLYLARQKRR